MKLTIGKKTVLYDKEDEHLVLQYKWHINDSGYAVWRGVVGGQKKTIRLHRLIANTPPGMITDHINHNRLDNRRSNLRVCTQSLNMRNLKNQGKGYWFHKQNNNWVVEIYGKHIGVFTTESEAMLIAKTIRAGGTYTKPERTLCKYGHKLDNAYIVNGKKRCKICQSIRSKKYYERKTKR